MFRLRIALYTTIREWIAGMSSDTNTHWGMTKNTTLGIGTTQSWAWVLALLIYTCQVVGTFRVCDAFRTAIGRGSYEIFQA